MRVAINAWFLDKPTTGSGQYARHLVERLAALDKGLELVLVTLGKSQVASRKLRVASEQVANLPLAHLQKVWFEQIDFPRACRRLGADVAHVPYWAPPLRPSIPTLVTIHDLIPLLLPEYRGGPLVRLYTALVARAARSASMVLTDSLASQRDIIAHLALPRDRVRVTYLAAGKQYTPQAASDAARARYGLPGQYVLYLGGFDVRKNVAAVIDVYRRAVPAIGETHPLVIAGRLPERDIAFTPDPRRLVRERGIDQRRVHFTGFVDEEHKPALYRGAAAFLFPSRYEGFGLMPLEAMACGTPVVGSNISSIPEVVGDGGVLLAPDDVEGMAQALIRLATDKAYRTSLSDRALAQAARFSWEKTARETLAAYRQVASGK